MARGAFDCTFTYEIVYDDSEVISVGGYGDKDLCAWVQKYSSKESGEIQVRTHIEWEVSRGCASGPPDFWEQPYYNDERTIESVTLGEGKDEQILPFQTAGEGVRAEIQRLVYEEDVDPPSHYGYCKLLKED